MLKTSLLRLTLLTILCIATLMAGFAEAPKLEYKVMTFRTAYNGTFYLLEVPEGALNDLGKEGWELVSSSMTHATSLDKTNPGGVFDHSKDSVASNVHTESIVLIFKRQWQPEKLAPLKVKH